MIRSGGIFAELRSQMLSAIPERSLAPFRAEQTLGDWIEYGSYIVTNSGRRSVQLEASPIDFGSVLLTETENLLNHCLEHLQELIIFANDSRGRSDAWAAVTGYYLGFFSASALLRLLGRPIAFLSREQLKQLQILGGSNQRPNQGAFEIVVGPTVSLTYREVSLTQSEKVHEATWKSILRTLNDLNRNPAISKHPEEADFYDSLCTTLFCTSGVGFDWPSVVRNRANYRPGYAYKLSANTLRVVAAVEVWRKLTIGDVFAKVRAVYRECTVANRSIHHEVTMMIAIAVSLYLLLRSLYAELTERRDMDSRWEVLRKRFLRRLLPQEDEFSALAGFS